MSAKHDKSGPEIQHTEPPDFPMDWRNIVETVCKRLDRVLHRNDVPFESFREIQHAHSELLKLREAYRSVLNGLEGVAGGKPKFKAPSIEEVQLYAAKAGISGPDADWFWNKMEGVGWKVAGQPVVSWSRTMTSWKLGGWFPSQKQVKQFGPVRANGTSKSLAEKDLDDLDRQLNRLL